MLRWSADLCLHHPLAAVTAMAAIALGIQMLVDARLGDVAEYFNAWHVLLAVKEAVGGGDPLSVNFLMGQRCLGSLALPVGLVVLAVQPLLYGSILVLALRTCFQAFLGEGG